MSKVVTVAGDRLLVKGQSLLIRGGEVHYFRLPVSEWRDRLQKALDCGLNTVSTYMPWFWHEPSEGSVDLNGATLPERNLKHFLDLVSEVGLKVIARPGPFINSELRFGGFPEWLFQDHPETLSRRSDGRIAPGRPIPAEGDPVYRDYVRRWYSRVVPLISEYQVQHGGPVILFQPDNEISAAWSYGLLNSLYDPVVLTETWPNWLRANYGDLDNLSSRHSIRYGSFKQVNPPRRFPGSVYEKRLCRDWMDFKRWFFADWGATLAQWAIEEGIQVPMMFNEPVAGYFGHGDHAGFGRILKGRGIEGMTACHTYASALTDLEGAAGIGLAVELTKSSPWGGPPMVAELNTNWYMPRLDRSDINWEPMLRLGLAHGVRGSVVYPFSAGVVDSRDVIDGPEYWDPSCIAIDGRPGDAYGYLRRFNRFVGAWDKELNSCRMVADVTVGYTPGQKLLDFLGAPSLLLNDTKDQAPGGGTFDSEPVLDRSDASPGHDWLDGYEGVSKQTIPPEAGLWKKTRETLLLLTRMNISYDVLDITNPNRDPGNGWIVMPCTGSLDSEAIEYLIAHLNAGGGCLFFPTVPMFDLDGVPDSRLADRLGVRLTKQVRPAGGEVMDYGSRGIDFGNGEMVGVYGWIFCHDIPQESTVLATHEGEPILSVLPSRNGNVLLAGMDMMFTTVSSIKLWETIVCQAMGVRPSVTCSGNYIHTLLSKGESGSLLVATNLTGRTGHSTLSVRGLSGNSHAVSFTIDLAPHESRSLMLDVPLGDNQLVYATSEIIPISDDRSTVELYGSCGTPGELAFSKPVSGLMNGSPITSLPVDGLHTIRYEHSKEPTVLYLDR